MAMPKGRLASLLVLSALIASAAALPEMAKAQALQNAAVNTTPPAAAPAAVSNTGPYGPWQVDLTGFAWAPSSNGHVTVRGYEAPANARFTQIVKKSDSLIAFMSHLEIHNDDFGMIFQPMYMDLGFKSPGGIFQSKIDVSLFYLELGGFYRFARGTIGDPADGRAWSVDATLTARYTQLSAGATFANTSISPSGQNEWVEPLVGLRGRVKLTRNIGFEAGGDIGGFGAGSFFAWDAQAAFTYDFPLFGRASTVFAGWKALAQNYKTGSGSDEFRWRTVLNGPGFGLTTHF